jgi:Domain of unknown function (DUF4145)
VSLLICDCPRCGSTKITFDCRSANLAERLRRYDWAYGYEVFSVCRHCHLSTVFEIRLSVYDARQTFSEAHKLFELKTSLNDFFEITGFVSLKDNYGIEAPEHLPPDISGAFREGASCFSIGCYNAAATMLRLCLDLATRPLLPPHVENVGDKVGAPNSRQRRDLGLRLQWLFERNKLPSDLAELAKCIREDANDGAHVGNLGKADAEDLLDFTLVLLERLFTEPKRLELALNRRNMRRESPSHQQ